MGILVNNKVSNFTDIDYKTINNIKAVSLDMINMTLSNKTSTMLSCVPIIYTLYTKNMNFDITNDKWINRDRFVLSKSIDSSLLYTMLFFSGFNISLEDLKKYKRMDSKTPGNMLLNVTPGVDSSTVLEGDAVATAVGMAISEKYLSNRYCFFKNKSVIDHYTYVLCTIEELMNGKCYESSSLAGSLSLGKLIILFNSNDILKKDIKENILERFKAMNFDIQKVLDGNNLDEINNAINRAKKVTNKPSIIEIKTIFGEGLKGQNTVDIVEKPIDNKELIQLKHKLDIRDIPFTIYEETIDHVLNITKERNNLALKEYNKLLDKAHTKLSKEYLNELDNLMNNKYCLDINTLKYSDNYNLNDKGINLSNNLLNNLITNNLIINGIASFEKKSSNDLKTGEELTINNLSGKNIILGNIEASSSIMTGICSSGIRCILEDKLTNSYKLISSIKASIINKLPIIYVLSSDSFLCNNDGFIDQPLEQLASLRSIPDLTIYRPYDANEILGAFKCALLNNETCVIVITNEQLKARKTTRINEVERGAYLIKKEKKPCGIIIATGYQLRVAIDVYKKLKNIGVLVNVVSMPSIEKFYEQDLKYQEKILPNAISKAVIEFSSPYSWYKIIPNDKYIFSINKFGKSGTIEELEEYYKLTTDEIYNKIKKIFM